MSSSESVCLDSKGSATEDVGACGWKRDSRRLTDDVIPQEAELRLHVLLASGQCVCSQARLVVGDLPNLGSHGFIPNFQRFTFETHRFGLCLT